MLFHRRSFATIYIEEEYVLLDDRFLLRERQWNYICASQLTRVYKLIDETSSLWEFFFFFLMIRRPPRSTLFPYRRSSDLGKLGGLKCNFRSHFSCMLRRNNFLISDFHSSATYCASTSTEILLMNINHKIQTLQLSIKPTIPPFLQNQNRKSGMIAARNKEKQQNTMQQEFFFAI